MSDFFQSVLENADYFVLLLFRMAALVVSSPLFGRVHVPNTVKVGFAVSLGVFAFIFFPPVQPVVYGSLVGFVMAILGEVLIGVVLAFVTNMFFSLTFIGGQMIDMQIGFGIVNVYDQQNNTQVPMVGNLLNIILLLVFWGVDGHHRMIDILFLTLRRFPVGSVAMSADAGLAAAELFSKAFTLGVMVALPVIASGLIIEFGFGALMRTVPQLNMFVVGMPVKLLIGMLMLLVTIPVFTRFSSTIFSEMFDGVERMFSVFYSTAV